MGHHHNSHHHGHHTATDGGGGGLSQRVNSPRFSGPMTRRAHSFKRNNSGSNNNNSSNNTNNNNNNSSQNNQSSNSNSGSHQHEVIDLHLNSPRSESPVSGDGPESLRPTHVSSVAQRVHLRRKISSLSVDLGGFGLEIKERRKLGQWMFLMFCGMCLFLGVFKICATGWFGSAIDRLGGNQVDHLFKHCINSSIVHASDYLKQFPSPILTIVAKFISIVSGGFASVLIIIAFLEESLLEGHIFGRNLFWYAAVFGTITAISRAAMVDEILVLDLQGAMSLVVQHTHYMPKRWRVKENTETVRLEFETLFQSGILFFRTPLNKTSSAAAGMSYSQIEV